MKVTAIVGTYRKQGIIDTVIDEILSSARQEGADVSKIYLIDKHIKFCTNCRTCTQEKGVARGRCILDDDMISILEEIERSDAIILGSPMNFGTVTAVMKRFIERLACLAYWPWGMMSPKQRISTRNRKALIVVSSAAPSILVRLQTGIVGLLKNASVILGAKPSGVLLVGLAARKQHQGINERTRKKARLAGRKLIAQN
ncbi:MAG TPA: flavodoxin family protein [Deltaproteobacteria bacterium]|nr:flavodoxin family protein [Deltaproteobacteria bacterium]